MIFNLRDKLSRLGKATFSKGELSLILGVYSRRVQQGIWRDYAIDSLRDMAVFSVFRSSHEKPLYAIAKIATRGAPHGARFVVYEGQKTVKQGNSLGEVLAFFDEEKN